MPMRRATVAVRVLLGIAAISGCSRSSPRAVVAIERTHSYHRPTCPPVNMARTVMVTLEDAKAKKLTPCPLCHPDSI
ncbi:MAG: hypothetical protein AB1428_08710 [Bacteroidota bacterium]